VSRLVSYAEGTKVISIHAMNKRGRGSTVPLIFNLGTR